MVDIVLGVWHHSDTRRNGLNGFSRKHYGITVICTSLLGDVIPWDLLVKDIELTLPCAEMSRSVLPLPAYETVFSPMHYEKIPPQKYQYDHVVGHAITSLKLGVATWPAGLYCRPLALEHFGQKTIN
jgi:hypothetical protein